MYISQNEVYVYFSSFVVVVTSKAFLGLRKIFLGSLLSIVRFAVYLYSLFTVLAYIAFFLLKGYTFSDQNLPEEYSSNQHYASCRNLKSCLRQFGFFALIGHKGGTETFKTFKDFAPSA